MFASMADSPLLSCYAVPYEHSPTQAVSVGLLRKFHYLPSWYISLAGPYVGSLLYQATVGIHKQLLQTLGPTAAPLSNFPTSKSSRQKRNQVYAVVRRTAKYMTTMVIEHLEDSKPQRVTSDTSKTAPQGSTLIGVLSLDRLTRTSGAPTSFIGICIRRIKSRGKSGSLMPRLRSR